MNTDNYRKYNVNYNTFDFLLFIALEEEIQEGRFIMMVIDHQTNKRVFYSRKNIEENQIIFDTLYREAEKQGSFLDGAHAMKQNGLGTMQANFSHSMYFNGIEIGENIG